MKKRFRIYSLVFSLIFSSLLSVHAQTPTLATGDISDSEESGCCTDTGQCSGWFGPQSTCTLGNGSCKSGMQCNGGTPNYYVGPGESCGGMSTLEAYQRCSTRVCINDVCAQPCGNDLSCITGRYPQQNTQDENQVCNTALCDCTHVLATHESPITYASSPLPDSLCGDSRCISYHQGTVGGTIGTALVCYGALQSACTENTCNINTDVTSHDVIVDTTCLAAGDYTVNVYKSFSRQESDLLGTRTITVTTGQHTVTVPRASLPTAPANITEVTVDIIDSNDDNGGSCSGQVPLSVFTPGEGDTQVGGPGAFNLCQQSGNNPKCISCAANNGIWTGIGCIPYNNATQTVRAFIQIGLGIAGGVVVLMTLAGAFLVSTSQGEPKRVDEGKSLITSAVAGILFIIFSVTILRFIGVSILQLPDFG